MVSKKISLRTWLVLFAVFCFFTTMMLQISFVNKLQLEVIELRNENDDLEMQFNEIKANYDSIFDSYYDHLHNDIFIKT